MGPGRDRVTRSGASPSSKPTLCGGAHQGEQHGARGGLPCGQLGTVAGRLQAVSGSPPVLPFTPARGTGPSRRGRQRPSNLKPLPPHCGVAKGRPTEAMPQGASRRAVLEPAARALACAGRPHRQTTARLRTDPSRHPHRPGVRRRQPGHAAHSKSHSGRRTAVSRRAGRPDDQVLFS